MHTYPINLLLQNRSCLVVGGGPVALRKAARLLAAAAQVKIVAPAVVAGLRGLAAAGRLELVLRRCRESDLEGVFLVFFASDDHGFNRQMMTEAQKLGILSCAVDENWSAGDFITPASCEGAGLQLAIATGGRSCVRAKSVKDFFSSQLETLAAAVILTTFTIAGEKFAEKFNADLLNQVVASLNLVSGVREFAAYLDADSLEVVALLGRDEQVNRLLRLIFVDAVMGTAGVDIKECRGEEAFAYLVCKAAESGGNGQRSFLKDCSIDCRVGSGLRHLNSFLTENETLQAGAKRGWREYADYCRKL